MSNEIIDRLRGQLQNCVNHLDRMKRKNPSYDKTLSPCIESANKALYETLHAEYALQPSLPQDVEELIEKNELVVAAGSEVNSVIKTSALRAFLAGKVFVPVEPTEQMVEAGCRQHICEQQDPWYSSTEISEFDCRAIYSAMLTASKQEDDV